MSCSSGAIRREHRSQRRWWIGSVHRRGLRTRPPPLGWARSGSCSAIGCPAARTPRSGPLTPRGGWPPREAVAAEVAAALRISQGLAGSRLRYARAMRERLPQVADVFKAGDIDFRMFATIVYRTDLITDDEVLAAVDEQLAVNVARWPSMTRARLAGQVDKIVGRVDADAVRRRKEHQGARHADLGERG